MNKKELSEQEIIEKVVLGEGKTARRSGPIVAGLAEPIKVTAEKDPAQAATQDSVKHPTATLDYESARKSPKKPGKAKKITSIITMILGLATLIGGVVFLLIHLMAAPAVRDAEYLVEVGEWMLEGEPRVVWNFTEVGKGTLTTNGHTNDYDFIWAMEGETLRVETDWLYTLDDAYTYLLDQETGTLSLTADDITATFVPATTIQQ